MAQDNSALAAADLELYVTLAKSKQTGTWLDVCKDQGKDLIAAGKTQEAKLILEAGLESTTPDLECYKLHIQSCMEATPPQSYEALQSAHEMMHAAQKVNTGDATTQAVLAEAIAQILAFRDHRSYGADARQAHSASALQLLTQLTQAQAGHASAEYHLALLLASTGRHDAAVQHTKAALAASQAQGGSQVLQPSMALLALLLSARGEHQAALAVVTKALQVQGSSSKSTHSSTRPGSSPAPGGPLPPSELLLLRIKAAVLAAGGDHNAALQALAACRKAHHQQAAGGASKEAALWSDMSSLYLAQGLAADALQCGQHQARLAPHSAAALLALGAAREAAGDTEAAQGCYSSALALEPSHVGAMIALGSLHRRAGGAAGLAQAQLLLGSALQEAPLRAAAWREAGLLAQAAGDLGGAEQQLARAVELSSTEPVLDYEELPLVL